MGGVRELLKLNFAGTCTCEALTTHFKSVERKTFCLSNQTLKLSKIREKKTGKNFKDKNVKNIRAKSFQKT